MGSISVTSTRAPKPRMEWAQPLPTSPYPAMTTTLPAIMMSVARLMPSARDSRQPYKLSNLDLVTESFTLMAGNNSLPCSESWYRRWTPVVVSSDTPRTFAATLVQWPGLVLWPSMMRSMRTRASLESQGLSSTEGSRSASTPRWIIRVASPPSSTMRSGPEPSGHVRAISVHHQ